MDSIFVNLIAGDIYKKCFREVVPRDRPVEQADQDELDNCINKFHESYKIVTGAFVNFVKAQPSKAFRPDED